MNNPSTLHPPYPPCFVKNSIPLPYPTDYHGAFIRLLWDNDPLSGYVFGLIRIGSG